MIVSFAEKSTQIWEIPFPAVTLCPQIKTKQTVFNYTRYYHLIKKNLTATEGLEKEELSRLKSAAQVCKTPLRGYSKIGSTNTTNEIYTNLRQIGPEVLDIMYHCDFSGHKSVNCTDWFKEIWTEEGLCYTFNLLNGSDLYRTHK